MCVCVCVSCSNSGTLYIVLYKLLVFIDILNEEEELLCVMFDRTNGVLQTSCQWMAVSSVELKVKQPFIRMHRHGKSTIVVHKLSIIFFLAIANRPIY